MFKSLKCGTLMQIVEAVLSREPESDTCNLGKLIQITTSLTLNHLDRNMMN